MKIVDGYLHADQQEREMLSFLLAKNPKVMNETIFAEFAKAKHGWTYVHENQTMHTGHEYYAFGNEDKFFYFPYAQIHDQVKELVDNGKTAISVFDNTVVS